MKQNSVLVEPWYSPTGHEHRSRSYYTILSFLPAINDSLTFINGHIHKRLCPAQVPWSSTKLWERTIQNKASRHRTKRSAIQNGRCLFAVAPFMLALLALIGLEKFRSFQKLNRIPRTLDAFKGRRDDEKERAAA